MRKVLVTIGAILFLIFGMFHLAFWKLFHWEKQLALLYPVNSNIMQMLNLCFCIFMFSFAYLLFFHRKEILNTNLGRALLICFSIMFFGRLIMEFAFPDGSLILGFILLLTSLVYFLPAIFKDKTKE